MDRIWRMLVAIFLLCAAIAMGMLVTFFQNSVIGVVCVYAMLILAPIGIIKGFYNIFCYRPEPEEKQATEA